MPNRSLVPNNYDLLVFDWDGTLMDSAAHIAGALQAAFRDLGLPVPSGESARHVIGLGLEDAMRYLNPALETHRYQEIADRYRVHFLAGDQDVELFPSVSDGILTLNQGGYLMAVATGKSRRGLERSLATGKHSPSIATVRKYVGACGKRLVLRVA